MADTRRPERVRDIIHDLLSPYKMNMMSFLSKILRKGINGEWHQRCNCAEKSVEDVNYGLGFNDVDFSDRVLHLEIEKPVTGLELEILNVSSLMLAAKSPFFYKLFKNGRKESQKNAAFTLRINGSEKAAFMDMLNSVYDRPLTASSHEELVDVMLVAYKFDVTSCARQCVQLLIKSHMTVQSALVYLTFPSILPILDEVTRPLVDAAKKHLSSHFSGFTELQQKEAMSLPLCGIEAVVGGADFQVDSEEVLLDFLLMWARKNYPELEERRDILTNRLLGFICFPCMRTLKLKDLVDCPDFDTAQVAKLAFNTLFQKIEPPQGTNSTTSTVSEGSNPNCAFPRRRYNNSRVVFLDIKKQDCLATVANSSSIYSEAFCLGGQCFSLGAFRYKESWSSNDRLSIYVKMQGSGTCTLNCEISAMKKPSYKFERMYKSITHTFTRTSPTLMTGNATIPWTDIIGDGNYMIDGVIHIRAQLTLKD